MCESQLEREILHRLFTGLAAGRSSAAGRGERWSRLREERAEKEGTGGEPKQRKWLRRQRRTGEEIKILISAGRPYKGRADLPSGVLDRRDGRAGTRPTAP